MPRPNQHRDARIWSNDELRRFAPQLDGGDVINVSAWQDRDKQGGHYRDYFPNARSYSLTNYVAEARGLQGVAGERFLDLTAPLPADCAQAFDTVFCHTVLEHVFDVFTAFANLCAMSREWVVVVVPFRQKQHGLYGDYWRFTPQALARLFERSGLALQYASASPGSVRYVFAIGARHEWPEIHAAEGNLLPHLYEKVGYI